MLDEPRGQEDDATEPGGVRGGGKAWMRLQRPDPGQGQGLYQSSVRMPSLVLSFWDTL